MKILLVKPPKNKNVISTSLYEPLELEYLAASVHNHDVEILDMRIHRNLRSTLLRFNPELIGLTAYTCDYNITRSILKQIRQFSEKIIIAVGGAHATFMPQDFILPEVNVIFLGYADTTFPRYIEHINNHAELVKIPNIVLIKDGVAEYTHRIDLKPDIENLPLPARHITRKYRKFYHDPVRNRLALVMTSRGCPFKCNFCACWKLMHGKVVMRSAESIAHELKTLPNDISVVYFSDDNTFSDIERMWKLSELLKKHNIKKKLQMYARADTIVKHPDLFLELKTSGLQFLTVGLESFQDDDLDYFNKKTSVNVNDQAIRILKDLDIHILSHFIIRPDYDKADFKKLYNYVVLNNLYRPAFPVLTPLPGTELYKETKSLFQIRNFDFFDFAHSILPTKLEADDFYQQLASLYQKSYSIRRYSKHIMSRMMALNRKKYYTDNTDGITLFKLILVKLFTVYTFHKLRNSHKNKLLKKYL